jgi:hypothetical protein
MLRLLVSWHGTIRGSGYLGSRAGRAIRVACFTRSTARAPGTSGPTPPTSTLRTPRTSCCCRRVQRIRFEQLLRTVTVTRLRASGKRLLHRALVSFFFVFFYVGWYRTLYTKNLLFLVIKIKCRTYFNLDEVLWHQMSAKQTFNLFVFCSAWQVCSRSFRLVLRNNGVVNFDRSIYDCIHHL